MGPENGGRGGTKKEKEKIHHMCESIGHRPLRDRCPKRIEAMYFTSVDVAASPRSSLLRVRPLGANDITPEMTGIRPSRPSRADSRVSRSRPGKKAKIIFFVLSLCSNPVCLIFDKKWSDGQQYPSAA